MRNRCVRFVGNPSSKRISESGGLAISSVKMEGWPMNPVMLLGVSHGMSWSWVEQVHLSAAIAHPAHVLLASRRSSGVSFRFWREKSRALSGMCNPTCIAALLNADARMKLGSLRMDAVGNGQRQRSDMACKSKQECGGNRSIFQTRSVTPGTRVANMVEFSSSWRAAMTAIAQKRSTDRRKQESGVIGVSINST